MPSFFRVLLTSSAFLLMTSSALPTVSPSSPIPPSRDLWYTAPDDYASTAPGTVLRFRSAPGNLTSVFVNCSAAYNILYRTTNSHYQPSWAVTTLLIPSSVVNTTSSNSTSTSALLSYQIPYNSASVDSSPSYALYSEGQGFPDIPEALGLGWFVNIPDFEGPLASFAAGVEEGHATLDSVRAVLSLSSQIGLSTDARYALWGYSGGSIASEYAAELQVQYAPELSFSGVAVGGMPTNASNILAEIDGTVWAGLIPSLLLGITQQYPDARAYMFSRLQKSGPYNATTFLLAENMSYAEAHEFYANQSIHNYFINGAADLQAPVMQHMFDREVNMGYHGVPEMPMLMYKAIADELSPVAYVDTLVERYCSVGANILYQRNTIGGHLAEYYNGDATAFDWLSAVLDGTYANKYLTEGCTIQDVALNVTSSPL